MAPTPVTYRGPKDRLDATTEIEVRVDDVDYVFPYDRVGGVRGEEPGPVPEAVVERLRADDLSGHEFAYGDEEPSNAAAAAPSTDPPAAAEPENGQAAESAEAPAPPEGDPPAEAPAPSDASATPIEAPPRRQTTRARSGPQS